MKKRYVANISLYIWVDDENLDIDKMDKKAIKKAKDIAKKIDKIFGGDAEVEKLFEQAFGTIGNRKIEL